MAVDRQIASYPNTLAYLVTNLQAKQRGLTTEANGAHDETVWGGIHKGFVVFKDVDLDTHILATQKYYDVSAATWVRRGNIFGDLDVEQVYTETGFRDQYLAADLPISETGEVALAGGFTATSIVGCLNELYSTIATPTNLWVALTADTLAPKAASGYDYIYCNDGLKDQYVSTALTVGESGATALVGFTATSIVGCLNELMTGASNHWVRTSTTLNTKVVADSVRIGSAGTVTNAAYLLELYRSTTTATGIHVYNSNGGTSANALVKVAADVAAGYIQAGSSTNLVTTHQDKFIISTDGSAAAALAIFTDTGQSIEMYTGGATAANLRVEIDSTGRVGIGTLATTPDGTLHVHTATAGVVTASTAADEGVFENSSDSGISILTPDANSGAVFFGSPSDNVGASLQWVYNNLLFTIGTSTANAELRLRSGNGVEAGRINANGNWFVGTGGGTADGTLHIHTATAGIVTADTNANDLTVESGGNTGISMLSPNSNQSALIWGSPLNGAYVSISARQSSGLMNISTNLSGGQIVFSIDTATEAGRINANGNWFVGAGGGTAGSLLDVRGLAGAAGILTLSTAELTVVDGDKLGRIDFQAPLESSGTDAVVVGASIWAEASDTFAADNNETDIVIAVATSGAVVEAMRINALRFIGMGISDPETYVHINTYTDVSKGVLIENSNDGVAIGPILNLFRNSVSPAADDLIGGTIYQGQNSVGGGATNYAYVSGKIISPADGSEEGAVSLGSYSAGVKNEIVEISDNAVIINRNTGIGITPLCNLHVQTDSATAGTEVMVKNDTGGTGSYASVQVISNSCEGNITAYDDAYTGNTEFQDKIVVYANSVTTSLALVSAKSDGLIEMYTGGATSGDKVVTIGLPTVDFDVNGITRLGDSTTNYTSWSAVGVQTMEGSAKVTKTKSFTFDYARVQGAGKPTQVTQGVFNGFSLPLYSADDEELFTCDCMPGDWDGTTDPVIYLGGWLPSANTLKKFKLQVSVETIDMSNNDVVPTTSNDYETETTTSTWAAYTSFTAKFTIASDIGLVCGQPLAIRIRRIDSSVNEITGEVVIEGAMISYVANKLGVAT